MRKIFLFVFMLMPIACGAHSMHIGDEEIPFHSTQYTTPSMHVQIGNEIVHAPAVKKDIRNTLHVLYNNSVYSICRGTERKVGNHYFVGDCLVAADDNVYLESSGTQYIDTGLSMPNGIRAVSKLKLTNIVPPIHTQYSVLFGTHNKEAPYGRNYFLLEYQNGTSKFNYGAGGFMKFLEGQIDFDAAYNVDISTIINNRHIIINGDSYNISFNENGDRSNNNIYLFYINGTPNPTYTKTYARIYNILFYNEYNVLVRHFVPVPAGLQIGNFTVPSNGMWDIVEQKFYGNDGTDDFIYGVDE